MAILSYNEILPKKYIVLDGEPYEVLSSHVFRKQQRKPVNQTKLKSVRSGKVIERTFHQSESVEEAVLERRDIKYLYRKGDELWFCNKDNPRDRFSFSTDIAGSEVSFLKENELVESLIFDNTTIGIKLPIKIELAVVEAPPGTRGNTAQGGTKQVTLESGAVLNVPLFINEGDIIRVNTQTGSYVERVEKK